jgi:hypothetical protein
MATGCSSPAASRGRAGCARVIRTTDDLVTGIAAAALLAQMDGTGGVRVLGDWHGTPGSEPPSDKPLPGDAA